MSTPWIHRPAANGTTMLRPGVAAAPEASLEPEFTKHGLVELVEHPLTPEDVAELLRIDRETVYRMARRGELPAFKLARRWRFLPSRLQRWMEEQETGPLSRR